MPQTIHLFSGISLSSNPWKRTNQTQKGGGKQPNHSPTKYHRIRPKILNSLTSENVANSGLHFGLRFDGARSSKTAGTWPPYTTGGNAALAASANGVVSFRSYDIDPTRLVRFDRTGRRLGEIGQTGPYFQFSLSSDGHRLGTQRNQGLKAEIWTIDIDRGTAAKATEASAASSPVWSPDGKDLAFVTESSGVRTAFRLSIADGRATTLADGLGNPIIEDWSRDGRYLAYLNANGVWAVPLFGDRKPFEVVRSRIGLDEPQISPDGRSIAYHAADTGRSEVYVQPFPGPGGSIAVSTSGGAQPMWRADGKELFYLAPDGTLMAAEMRDGQPAPTAPTPLLKTGLAVETIRTQYAPLPDGQQFIVMEPEQQAAIRPIQVVINWPATVAR